MTIFLNDVPLVWRPDVHKGKTEHLDKLTHKTGEYVTGSHMTFSAVHEMALCFVCKRA